MDITFWIIFICLKYIWLVLDLSQLIFKKVQQTLKHLKTFYIKFKMAN